ncbi:MAG: putative FAD-binding protein [Actinotalea sp.]|nr:putative FAD-binding protein [Actinotalea sp.]
MSSDRGDGMGMSDGAAGRSMPPGRPTTGTGPRRGRRRERPEHVLVIGASLAGAFAAAAAAGDGRRVTLVERDVLPDHPRPRDGVPQGRQPHVFLYRGLLAVEELLPGFGTRLRAAGAVPFDTGDLAWLGEFGWAPSNRKQFGVLSATRPLFDHLVLTRVRDLPGVTVLDGSRVTALRPGPSDGPRWLVDLADGTGRAADLVIDSTGRASRLPVWLDEVGVSAPAVSAVDARIGYATRTYAIERAPSGVAGVVLLQTPDLRRGALALPVEDGRWIVGAVGAGDRRPPREVDGFEEFLAGLPDSAVAALVATGQADDGVAVHRRTGNQRHHYERLRDWPPGLLVLGDALCAFNPVYGQGVTVAACEALLLRDALRRGLRPGDERRLLRAFTRVAALPWAIATGEDLRYPTSTGEVSRNQALLGRWTRELGRLSAHGDTLAQASMARVYHLMAPPWLLFRPGLVSHALRARVRGYGPPTPRPPVGGGPTPSGAPRPSGHPTVSAAAAGTPAPTAAGTPPSGAPATPGPAGRRSSRGDHR